MILLGKLASFLLWWTTHKTILLQQSIIFLDSFHSTYNRLRTKSTKPDGEKESRGREKKATARIFPYSATGVTEPIFNLFWFPTQSSRCKKVCHLRDLVSRKRIDLTLFLAYFFADNVDHRILHWRSGVDQCVNLWHNWHLAFHQSPAKTRATQLFFHLSPGISYCWHEFLAFCSPCCGPTQFLALVSSIQPQLYTRPSLSSRPRDRENLELIEVELRKTELWFLAFIK